MAYIGQTPLTGSYSKLDDISTSFDDAEVTFNLTVNSTSVVPGTPQNLIISIDGVIQEPGTAYTVSNDQITFSEAPAASSEFFGVLLGATLNVGVVSDSTITTSKIVDSAVTTAKIADGNITTAKIADGNVTTSKIADSNITTDKIANSNITTAKIADYGVTSIKMSNSGVVAGTYGNVIAIPSITVDEAGRVTSATTAELSISSSGYFNTAISGAVGAAATDVMTTVYTAPSTTGARAVIYSIHVTNISGTDSNVTVQLYGDTYSNVTIANSIPIVSGGALELLLKPKVLQPNDQIQIKANANSTLHATLTIEESTESKYFGQGLDITTADTYEDLFIATANSVVESMQVTCDAPTGAASVTAVYTDGSNTIIGYYCYNLVVPAGSSIELFEQPKFIEDGNKIQIKTLIANTAEVIISGKTV